MSAPPRAEAGRNVGASNREADRNVRPTNSLGAGGAFEEDAGAPVAEPGPEEAVVEVDGGVDDVGGVGGFGDGVAGFVVDGGAEVVAAGDQVDLVFDGAGFGEGFVAAPDGDEDHFSAAGGELAGDFGVGDVPADHHADAAEIGVEDGVVVAGGDAAVDLFAGETDFAVFAEEFAVAVNEDGGVVEGLAIAFVEAGDEVGFIFGSALAEELSAGAGDGFGDVGVGEAGAADGDAFGEADDVGFFFAGFVDELGELVEVGLRSFGVAGAVVDGGDFNFAGRGRAGFFQVDVAPLDLALGGPAETKLKFGLFDFGGNFVGAGDGIEVARGRGANGHGKFGLLDLVARIVKPEDAGDDAAGGGFDAFGAVAGGEEDVFAFGDGDALEPAAVGGGIAAAGDEEGVVAGGIDFGIEVGADFIADGVGVPIGGGAGGSSVCGLGGLIGAEDGREELKNREN